MEERRESCSRIKDGNLRLALGEVEVRSILKEYFENLYYMNTQEQVEVHICGYDGTRKGNFLEEPIMRTEVEVKVGKLKNGKAAGKDEFTGEMVKGGL